MLDGVGAVTARTLLPVTACLLVAACGGRAATPPPADAATRAERLDGPAQAPPGSRREAAGTPVGGRQAGLAPEEVFEEDLQNGLPPLEDPEGSGGFIQHILQRGQTLYALARQYGVDLEELMQINGIVDPTKVPAGRPITIPGSGVPAPHTRPPAPGAQGGVDARGVRGVFLAWPLRGAITAAYGRRGKRSHHSGLDIDGHKGDPIKAAASGTVIRAGADGQYGRVVLIDHGDGLTTLYAHASKLLVQSGARVRAGETIAEVGGSGNARGTHLHFEVRRDGRPIDPMPYLRSRSVLTAGTH